MDGHFNGAWVTQMRLGWFKFSIYTAAYQSLDRSTEYKWGEQSIFNNYDDLQYLGPGTDTMSLQGVVFPEYRGGFDQIEMLRMLASQGKPQTLISGFGNVMGRWVILRVSEGQTIFAAGGKPRRIEFTVELRRFNGDKGEGLGIMDMLKNSVSIL